MSNQVVFKAMADGTRRRILQLVTRHEMNVSELVDCLRVPQSSVSRHLKVLRDAGLINDRREGTAVVYAMPDRSRNNGDASPLQWRMLDWVGEEDLPQGLATRLERILDHRRDQSHDFFSRVGNRWDQMRVDAFGDAFHLEALTALLPAEWQVADIGSGTGYLLPVLARTFAQVIAVDPVTEMLDVARARCAEEGVDNVTFRKGDLAALPIEEASLDLMLAVLVLHHVPSPTEALAELRRVTRPGGRLLVVEQHAHNLSDFHERMQDRWWGFEPDALARQVENAGFRAVTWRDLRPDPLTAGAIEGPGLFVLTAVEETPTRL